MGLHPVVLVEPLTTVGEVIKQYTVQVRSPSPESGLVGWFVGGGIIIGQMTKKRAS